MAEKKGERNLLRDILSRILRAAIMGFLMGGEVLIPLKFMPELSSKIESILPSGSSNFSNLIVIFAAFEVAIQLLRGTIIQYGLSIGRTIITIGLLIIFTNGGFITVTVPQEMLPQQVGAVQVTVDIRTIIGALLILSVLSIAKNLLQAVDFLSQKAERTAAST